MQWSSKPHVGDSLYVESFNKLLNIMLQRKARSYSVFEMNAP